MNILSRVSHWSPRYILARVLEICYHLQVPTDPWLTREANSILRAILKPSDVMVEFGSGRSTLWFAARVGRLCSVESDEGWYKRISGQINALPAGKVSYLYRPVPDPAGPGSAYSGVLDDFQDSSVDIVLVDGALRDFCALKAIPKLKAGGVLVVDNVNWFLPSQSKSPDSVAVDGAPASEGWKQFLGLVKGWQCRWTSSGVTDTAFYYKPG